MWDSRHFQQSKYAVFHEESESEVKNHQFLEPEGKTQEKRNQKISDKFCLMFLINFLIFLLGGPI